MMMDAFDRAAEREARARRARRTRPAWVRFKIHLRIYLTVNAVLAGIWAISQALGDHDHPWFLNVVAWWGVGLLVHYLFVVQITKQWRPPARSRAGGLRT